MHLWNDYEGKTLAGAFPLGRLLRTEGRSASFATHDRAGRDAVIRLTEALNDQAQMHARYSSIQAAAHPHLLIIQDFGDTEFEGTPLIYLVSEPTQESLSDILRERRLSVEETNDVATGVVGAVEALHGHGLMHGQVEPASVLAAGEVIKLRTDCVRAMPEGAEGESARQKDVFGVADVLHRALTQQPLVDASDALALPEPYASIVRNVVRGTWGLEQVASELRRSVRPAVPARPVAPEPAYAAAATSIGSPAYVAPTQPPASQRNSVDPPARRVPEATREAQLPLLYAVDEAGTGGPYSASAGTLSARALPDEDVAPRSKRPLILAALALGVLILLLLVWRVSERSNVSGRSATPAPAAATASAAVPGAGPAPPTPRQAKPAAAHAAVVPVTTPAERSPSIAAASAQGSKVWRVVAYTYNREDQAQAKVRLIDQQHATLHPQVFSRTGHAPYLVTLGGAMSEDQAAGVRQRARNEGLPRDVYMQNYSH